MISDLHNLNGPYVGRDDLGAPLPASDGGPGRPALQAHPKQGK